MKTSSLVSPLALALVTASASLGATHSQVSAPLLLPGSADLPVLPLTDKCRRVERFVQARDSTSKRSIGVQTVTESRGTFRGKPTILAVTASPKAEEFLGSSLVYANGLAPIREVYRGGKTRMQWDFDGSRVRFTSAVGDSAPVAKAHTYAHAVFNFQQLDLVVRALPLRAGYRALLPLYSEGDDSVEVDSVNVVRRLPNGAWEVRFVDPAIVATYGVDERTRGLVAYAHTFRADGPSWKRGNVWRQEYGGCGKALRP